MREVWRGIRRQVVGLVRWGFRRCRNCAPLVPAYFLPIFLPADFSARLLPSVSPSLCPPVGIRWNSVAPFDRIRRAADRIRRARDRFGSMRGSVCPDFGVKLMPAVGVGSPKLAASATREPPISTDERNRTADER